MEYYDYGSGLTSSQAAGLGAAGGILIAVILVILAICIVFAVLAIIGMWKMFEKSNQPGWASLIPYYNTYCMCKLAGINPWWVLIAAVAPMVLSFIPVIGSLAGTVVALYFTIILYLSVSRSFGKSDAYCVGLILLGPIFLFLLGRKEEQYLGPKPVQDIVFDKWFKQSNPASTATQVQENTTEEKTEENPNTESKQDEFCPQCGAKIEAGNEFCPQCGAKK